MVEVYNKDFQPGRFWGKEMALVLVNPWGLYCKALSLTCCSILLLSVGLQVRLQLFQVKCKLFGFRIGTDWHDFSSSKLQVLVQPFFLYGAT